MKTPVIVASLSILILFLVLVLFLFLFQDDLQRKENYQDINTAAAGLKNGIQPTNDNGLHYSSDNYNVEYHDAVSDIAVQSGIYDADSGIAWTMDACGNKIGLPALKGQEYITYYDPGTYVYGASNYVPTYEDSIYLSKMYRNQAYNK